MERRKLNIPNQTSEGWENLLTTQHIELNDNKNYFSAQYLDEALIELYERFMLQATNIESTQIVFGQPVCVTTNDECFLGNASDSSKVNVVGFIYTPIVQAGDVGFIKTEGIITNTVNHWNTLIETQDGSDGLLDGYSYYLSNLTPGKITTIAPSQQGEFVVPIGRALTQTHFKIDVDPIIGL